MQTLYFYTISPYNIDYNHTLIEARMENMNDIRNISTSCNRFFCSNN